MNQGYDEHLIQTIPVPFIDSITDDRRREVSPDLNL